MLATFSFDRGNSVDSISDELRNVEIDTLSSAMLRVRDYVPPYAVMAHRGSTYWTPEETESAYRWAREIGADYLEADLQMTKDGVVLAMHDDKLTRTTNIEKKFGTEIPATRKAYYLSLGYSEAEATAKYEADKANFKPYLTNFYTYEELLTLDAGSWFNVSSPERARPGYSSIPQYVSSLEDLVAYSKGKKLKRDANKQRVYRIVGKTGTTIKGPSGVSDVVKYEFEYVDDDVFSGNLPGIYIEFKEPLLNPEHFEQIVYDELDRLGMNIITQRAN
ncbi:MAG: glycerophosphodiester phosphodiesterase family protein, partial [Phocaeicola sp.]